MNQQDLEGAIQEVWTLFRETDRRLDRRFKATEKIFKETQKRLDQVSREISALTGKWGRFVEGLIAPGAVTMFKERGIGIDRIFQRVKAKKDGKEMEVDILGINKEYAILIEAKSTLVVEDVKEHIERMKVFKHFFPEYSVRKVVGAVAGIVIDEDADRFAYRQGFFVIGQTGEMVKILNDEEFNPKIW